MEPREPILQVHVRTVRPADEPDGAGTGPEGGSAVLLGLPEKNLLNHPKPFNFYIV